MIEFLAMVTGAVQTFDISSMTDVSAGVKHNKMVELCSCLAAALYTVKHK